MFEMNCPYCNEMGGLIATHRHLVDSHLDKVETVHEEDSGHMFYLVPCPFCGLKYRHRVKPRHRNPEFLQEFKAEIALVAFDQLLYHVLQNHSADVGVNLADLEME